MDPILMDIYSTIIPSAPFIIAAYAIFWIVLLAFIVVVARGLKRDEAQMALLEEEAQRRADKEMLSH